MKKILTFAMAVAITAASMSLAAQQPADATAANSPQTEAVAEDCNCDDDIDYTAYFDTADRSAAPEANYSGEVYICTGRKAFAYHSHKNCKGIQKCKSKIIKVSLAEAKDQGRTPCQICY